MRKKMIQIGKKTGLEVKDVNNLAKIGISGLLALTLSVLTAGWSYSSAAENNPQPKKSKSERCGLMYKSGPCQAHMKRYYYDAGTNKCEIFFYGGCEGVVPFGTYEECVSACVVQRPVGDAFHGHKYGGVGIRDFR